MPLLLGFPEYTSAGIYNSAALIVGGEIAAIHRKAELPNYKVFDEKRYFQPGAQPTVVDCHGLAGGTAGVRGHLGSRRRRSSARAAGAQLLLVINASPYEIHKQREREDVARARVRDVGLPLAYVNLVGGQDELVFDGNSFVMDAARRGRHARAGVRRRASTSSSSRAMRAARCIRARGSVAPELSDEASVYGALVLGRARLRAQARLSRASSWDSPAGWTPR